MSEQLWDGERKVSYEPEQNQNNLTFPVDEITQACQKAFGIKYLYPWQRIVISNILEAARSLEETQSTVLTPENSDCFFKTPNIDIEETLEDPQEPDTVLLKEILTESKQSDEIPEENSSLYEFIEETEKETAFIPPTKQETPQIEKDIFCNGRQIVLLPTGAGKSLCFLTPALLLNGPTLVLYPLLALMADQKRRMDEGNLKSVLFKGGQSEEERKKNIEEIKNGAKIILANPEVLQNNELIKELKECGIKHIAIDEAHCVSEWGDSFRPAYLSLGDIIKKLEVPVITAFTATASPSVLNRVAQVLFDGKAHIVQSDSDRSNIRYYTVNTFCKKKTALKLALEEEKPLIIFCGTRNKSEDMARELSLLYGTDNVKFYHAGMEKEEKDTIEKWFYPKKDGILCSTCAFGMGIDKKDIKTVIHLEVSPTAESYIQEAGRGGRDGSVAKAILLWSPEDSKNANRFPKGSRERVLQRFAQSKSCRRQILLKALGDSMTYCAGCDVCERKAPAPFAEDAQFILNFIRKNQRKFTKIELSQIIMKMFNKRDFKYANKNLWDHSDIMEILYGLTITGYIHTCLWPWKNKICCSYRKLHRVSSFYKSKTYRTYEAFLKKIILRRTQLHRRLLQIVQH